MPRKEPLYVKQSKAAKQLDYDYYPESERILRQYDYRNIKLQKTKKQLDYPNYDGHNPYRSDYNYDVDGNKYLAYESQSSTESSEPEVVLEGHQHKYSKDRVNRYFKKLVPDHSRKIKGSNNIIEQRSPQQSYYKKNMLKDQKDFNAPLELRKPRKKEQTRLEIAAAHSRPPGDYETYSNNFKNTPNYKILGKEQQGDSFQVYSTLNHTNNTIPEKNITELTSDIIQNLARLIYLPILVTSNNNILQSAGSIQPAARIVNRANKQPYRTTTTSIDSSTDLLDESHKAMSVFMANNNNMNGVFRKNIDITKSNGSKISLSERSKENIDEEMMAPSKLKNEMKSKSSKAQSQVKNSVPLKKVKKSEVENENPKIDCSEDPVNYFKEHFIIRSQSKENYTTKQETKQNKSESISYYKINKSEEGEENNKKPLYKGKTNLPQNGHEDFEEVEEAERVIININKTSLINGKPSIVKTKNSIISQDPMMMVSYKKVGQSQGGLKSKIRFPIQEQGVSLAKDQESDIYKTKFQLKENHGDDKNHPYTYIVQFCTMQTDEGKEKLLSKLNDNEITVVPKNKGVMREISFKELKDTPGATAQTGEEKKYENNSKSVSKSENVLKPAEKTSSRKLFHEREMIKYKINQEHLKKLQKENLIKSISNTAQVSKQQPKKPQSVTGDKIGKPEEHGEEFKTAKKSRSEKDRIDETNQLQLNTNCKEKATSKQKKPQSVTGDKIRKPEEHGEEFKTTKKSHSEKDRIDETNQLQFDKKRVSSLMEYLSGKPTVDIIHPPTEKSCTKQSTSSILQNKGGGEPFNGQKSQLLTQSEGKIKPLNDQPSQLLIQNEGKSEPLNDQPSQLLIQNEGKSEPLNDQPSQLLLQNEENSEPLSGQSFELPVLSYTEAFLIIAFRTAQYILGVSCFDKLLDVADFYYYEDD